MEPTQTHAEIIGELHDHQKSIIAALDFYNSEASKQKIRGYAKNFRRSGKIPEGSVHHHFSALVDAELIEQSGKERVGRGGYSDVYRLLPLGEMISGDIRDEEDAMTAEDVTNLCDRVEAHEESIESLQESVDDLEETFDSIKDTLLVVRAHLGIDSDADETDGNEQ